MNVLYCCDDRGFAGLEASIYSLLTHTKGVNIYVFSMEYHRKPDENNVIFCYADISPQHKDKLKKIVQYLDPKHSHIKFVDMLEYYHKFFREGCDEDDGHSSPYATLKLCFDEVCLSLSDILYLDCDTIIQSDLRPMYDKYLDELRQSNYCYAGYRIPLDKDPDEDRAEYKDELVASVLLFDLDKCRQKKFFQRVRYNVTHNFYTWYEQSAIEDTEKGLVMDETYNFMLNYEKRTYEPVILHFANELQPKIYYVPENYFYRRYPHLKYIQEGLKLVDTLPLKYK